MKFLKMLIEMLRFILVRNKMLIASGVSGKLNSGDALNDVLDGLEALEDELAEMNMMEMALLFILLLLSGLAAVLVLFAISAVAAPVLMAIVMILSAGALYANTGGKLLCAGNIQRTVSDFH
jgi:hypothetical protein